MISTHANPNEKGSVPHVDLSYEDVKSQRVHEVLLKQASIANNSTAEWDDEKI